MGRAPMASASITTGIPLSEDILSISETALNVASSRPNPGPMISAWVSRDPKASEMCVREASVRMSSSGKISGISVAGHSTLAAAALGIAMCTRSQPVRAAAIPASIGAPWYGPPPITHSRPRSPLRAFAVRGGYRLASPGPQSSTSAGHGNGATVTSPASGEASPCLILWKVRVAIDGRASNPPIPVGISQASTGVSSSTAQATISPIGALRLCPGEAPAPNRQSTTRV